MRIRTSSGPWGLLLVLTVLAASCTPAGQSTTTEAPVVSLPTTAAVTTTSMASTTTTASTTTSTTNPEGDGSTSSLRANAPFISGFEGIPIISDEPSYRGLATPDDISTALWIDEISDWVVDQHPDLFDRLAENGFVIVESGLTQFHQAYGAVDDYRRQPLFITTDAAYHYWHLVFAKALKDTEQQVLLPIVEAFAERLMALSEDQKATLAGTDIADAAKAAAGFAAVVAALAEVTEAPYDPAVQADLDRVEAHASFESSDAHGAMVDYTLFRPRGHYTETEDLTRYFLTMSALGGSAFRINQPGELLTAVMVSKLIVTDQQLGEWWRDLYEPTAFLVGLADDYTPFEVADAVASAGVDWHEPDQLTPLTLEAIRGELLSMRPVSIDPESASVRVMGARFVLDSYIIDQLVDPSVEGRLEASAMDVAAAFGSSWAAEQIDAAGVPSAFDDFAPQLAAMQALVGDRTADDWAGTVYDAWLYALQPSWTRRGTAFPDFMQTDAWAAKSHQAGFGSYTELKHDTVLYAKQGFAEGEGPPPPPAEPRHWVEPDPVVFARLAAMVELMRDGLAMRDLLADDVDELLGLLEDMYRRFTGLAWDELGGLPISVDDNAWLESIGARFELLWVLANEDDEAFPGAGGFSEVPYDMSGLVVDIMSNPAEALQLGTGLVDVIYVLVPNDQGQFQVARGGVFSFYEFWVPRSERMTDEEWRKLFVNEWGGQATDGPPPPERPAWILPILSERSDP